MAAIVHKKKMYCGGSGESLEPEIVDNLESTDTNKALSANMGRELDEKFSPKYIEYTYSTDMQTDVKNCIEKVIELYGTDIALTAFWLSKTTEGVNAYAGNITLASNLSKAAIRIEGTYCCSARNNIITFQYNVNDKVFIAFNNLGEKKEIGLNFFGSVDIISRNACFKQNGVYYIDVLITNYNNIPESNAFFEIIEDGQAIVFTKRVDVILYGCNKILPLLADAGDTALRANSHIIVPEIYRLTLTYQP